jgi:NADH dehydrogenase
LVIAAGSANNFFGLHEVEAHGFGFKELPEALAIRNHIITRFEQAESETDPEKLRRLLTFVVVGGGPTGIELAGAIAELVRHVMRRDHPTLDFGNVRLLLIEMMDRLIPSFPSSLSRNAQRTLERLGVEICLRTSVAGMRNGALQLKDGTEIQTDTVIWAAGVQGAPIGATLGVKLQRGGRIPVTPVLQLPGHPNVWVVGDLAYLEAPDGKPYPQLAAVAMQQGPTIARNILRKLRGEPLRPFRYLDKGTMATVGRHSAVARIWGINWTGSVAWLLWLAVHLLYLMGGRNRLLVFVNWIYNYLTYDRAARAVIAPSRHAQAATEVVELSKQPVVSTH